jgi:hypothetical protein
MGGSIALGGAAALSFAVAAALSAQSGGDRTVTIAPGERYRASGIHRFFLGSTYRDLWATPIRIPVLDLGSMGGGLVAFERGGSRQSRALRFRAADGRVFTFRALDKDPTQTWPEALRQSPARKFAEDQISAILPAGALAVAALEEAAGVLHPTLRLVVLPDDPRLGEWRAEFAGNPGILEDRVRGEGEAVAAIPGAAEVVTSQILSQRLRQDGRNLVDQPRFLAARLFDLFVGDWDRHGDQWGWARFDEGGRHRWVPIPRDRDWALSRLDGPLYGLLRLYLPKYQSFSSSYGRVYGLTLSAEALDRRLLGGLERPVWDSVTADLQARLTNDVIDRAVRRLPPEFPEAAMAELNAALRSRRDRLAEVAGGFYRQLAGAVELRGSEASDLFELEPLADGLAVRARDGGGGLRLSRRFAADETGEVRIFLFGGSDTVRTAAGDSPVRVRVIDEGGPLVADSASLRLATWYDSTRVFHPQVEPESPLVIHRDWGRLWSFTPWFEARPEIGMLVGGGPVIFSYGFRKVPYASRLALRLGYATGASGLNADLDADIRFERPSHRLLLRAAALRTDVVRYFGFGNETTRSDEIGFHSVRQQLYRIDPGFEWSVGRAARFTAGAFLRASATDLDRPTLLAADRPYGSGEFTIAGGQLTVGVDTRDHPAYPTRGIRAELVGRWAPAVFDAEEAFGGVDLTAAGFATARALPAKPTLAVRAGVSRDWGKVPFFEASSIGGRGSVRGLNSRRFLGEGAVFGSAELRLDLGGFTLIVPGDWGISALGDAGRVFLEGEDSNRWHTALGGGLWFAFLDRKSVMTLTYASSRERARFYLQAGFHF